MKNFERRRALAYMKRIEEARNQHFKKHQMLESQGQNNLITSYSEIKNFCKKNKLEWSYGAIRRDLNKMFSKVDYIHLSRDAYNMQKWFPDPYLACHLEFDEKKNCFINCRKTPGKPIFVVYFNSEQDDDEDSWKLGRLHIDFEDLELDFFDDYKIYATKDNLQKICDFMNEIDIDYIETWFDQIYGDDLFFGNDGF